MIFNFPRDPRRSQRGFSLIEMIGVMTILSVMAAVVAPNLIRQAVDTTATRENKNLEVLADGLVRYVQTTQLVPGGSSWSNAIANTTGLNLTQVVFADPANTTSRRVYLFHPGFTPSTALDPILTLSSSGVSAPTNAMILLISSTKRGLALPVTSGQAASVAAFNNIWNWSLNPFTKAAPTGWPATWRGNGAHLHVQRINLADQFVRVTVSNQNFPTNIPFAKFSQSATYPFDVTNAVDSYYLRGTVVRLYRHDEPYVAVPANPDELNITHTLQSDMNFIYDGAPARWRIP